MYAYNHQLYCAYLWFHKYLPARAALALLVGGADREGLPVLTLLEVKGGVEWA